VVRSGLNPDKPRDGTFFKAEIAMATMNHTNLTTYNVPALTEFFCSMLVFSS
jgi:hypothetical protein